MRTTITKKAASFAGQAALLTAFYGKQFSNIPFKSQAEQRRPSYIRDLISYPLTNPVLIAQSWNGLNLVKHKWGGTCLLCDKNPATYDFSALANREVWILRYPTDINDGIRLGKFIQLAGATSVFVITLWEGRYE